MKKIIIGISFLFVLSGTCVYAQRGVIQEEIDRIASELFSNERLFTPKTGTSSIAQLNQYVKQFSLLEADTKVLQRIATTKPEALEINLPLGNSFVTLQLTKSNVVDQQTIFRSQDRVIPYTPGAYYYGIIKGEENSIVAISFFNNTIIGVLANERGNYVLGKSNTLDTESNEYIFYHEKDLLLTKSPQCYTADDIPPTIPVIPTGAPPVLDKCVKVYIEADYQLYLNQGSLVNNVLNYVTGLFNVTTTLYRNESISTALSDVKVWTVGDPYRFASDMRGALTSFGNAMSGGFNGNLAHLFSGRSLGGGIAYLDALCKTSLYKVAVSAALDSYTPSFPTYSWSTMVVTHEMGHGLGSHHTHDCVWNGTNTAIDGCGPNAGYGPDPGGCPTAPEPVDGGTIMSYCHLRPVGINFNKGFGPQPGNLIRNKVSTSICVAVCCRSNVTITGLYSQPLTQSKGWIKSNGATTISPTSTVKLDADPINGYIELSTSGLMSPGYVIIAPTGTNMFVAQALDGCDINQPTLVGDNSSYLRLASDDTKIESVSSIRIYPNPAKESFTVHCEGGLIPTHIEVVDMFGYTQLVDIKDIDVYQKEITFKHPQPGVCIVIVQSSDSVNHKLIIVE